MAKLTQSAVYTPPCIKFTNLQSMSMDYLFLFHLLLFIFWYL